MTHTHTNNLLKLTVTGLLISVGIIIPYTFPRIHLGVASYTLASHVVIFVAMFISPRVSLAVAAGTTLGFFLGGMPIIIVLRAFSHLLWAFCGSVYLRQVPATIQSTVKLRIFSVVIGALHGILEFFTVILFFRLTTFPNDFNLWWFVVFVGLGTFVHSLVDFELALLVVTPLAKIPTFQKKLFGGISF